MTSPASMGRLQFGVMTRWGLAHLLDAGDDGPYWGTRQQAMWTLHSLRALHPDTEYRITTRKAPMDCPDCGRLLVLTDHGPDCRHCGEEA